MDISDDAPMTRAAAATHRDRQQERVLGAVIGFLGVCVCTRQKGFQGIFVRCASNSQIYVSKKKCVRNTGFGEKFTAKGFISLTFCF
jgi:hypothetical protein